MLPKQFQRLEREDDILVLDNKIFNAVQIVNQVLESLEPKGNDLKFSCKDKFVRKYFKKKNVQGIFNRVEWRFSLKQGIQCELVMPSNNGRQKGILEIKVSLEFSRPKKQISATINDENLSHSLSIKEIKSSENFEINVSLSFCPDVTEEFVEQNSSYFYFSNSEEIYVSSQPISLSKLWDSSRN
jgi:hypothetical protein